MPDVRSAARAGDLSFIEEPALHGWVVAQRWFGSKAREIAQLNVLESVALRDVPPLLVLTLVEARFPTGRHELYQVPLGLRPASEGWDKRVIAEADGWTVYDALADPELGRELLRLIKRGGERKIVLFENVEGAVDVGNSPDVRPMGAEQSNTSIVFSERLVLKAFRRLEPGDNPELELLRFLTERGFESIAPLAGWYSYAGRVLDATLGILQEFLADGSDGWDLALDAIAAGDGFIEPLRELGVVTGRMHAVLGSDQGDPTFAAEEPSEEALSLLTATLDEQIERLWSELPETDVLLPVLGRGQDVRERLQAMSHIGAGGRVIRTHGDYHLGQTMRTGRGWVILDFEGEPARPLPERRRKRSPLRDVAGMLRSFAYAASAVEMLRGTSAPGDWERHAREAFLEGYFETVDARLLPPGKDPTEKLLAIFELEKAVYELRYEMNNRPDWVGIPVAGIRRLLEEGWE